MRTAVRPQLVAQYEYLRGQLPIGLASYGDPNSLTIPQLQTAINSLQSVVSPGAVPVNNFQEQLEQYLNNRQASPFVPDIMAQAQGSFDPSGLTFSPPYSMDNLSSKQIWIQQQLEKDKNSLIGLEVRIVARPNGTVVSSLHDGTIVTIDDSTDPAVFSIDLEDKATYKCQLYQIEPLKNVKPDKQSQKDIQNAKALKVIKQIASSHSSVVNTQNRRLKEDLAYKERDLKARQEQVVSLQRSIGELKNNLPQEDNMTSGAELLKMVNELKKHDKVKSAFITTKGNIIVITHLLNAIDRDTDTEIKDKPMGQFLFKFFTAADMISIEATNLTYWMYRNRDGSYLGQGYPHPNISGTSICWGNNDIEVHSMKKLGQYYALLDFAITFFSLFPHADRSNPYIDFEEWYERKDPVDLNYSYIKDVYNRMFEEPLVFDEKVLKKDLDKNKPTVKIDDLVSKAPKIEEIDPEVGECDHCGRGHFNEDCPEYDYDGDEDEDE